MVCRKARCVQDYSPNIRTPSAPMHMRAQRASAANTHDYRSSARAHSNLHIPTAAKPTVYTPLAPIRTSGHLQPLSPPCVNIR
eukprot:1872418-Pyramimonas_sp.AAC.1